MFDSLKNVTVKILGQTIKAEDVTITRPYKLIGEAAAEKAEAETKAKGKP